MPSPILGFNTNVRHRGKLYHVQTEDSGIAYGHVYTHLFADGGRIVASKKSSYAKWIGTDRYPEIVKKLMRAQHKAMCVALRDGLFDEDEAAGAKAFAEREIVIDDEATPENPTPGSCAVDIEAFERAAGDLLEQSMTFAPSQGSNSTEGANPPLRPASDAALAPESESPTARRSPPSQGVDGAPHLGFSPGVGSPPSADSAPTSSTRPTAAASASGASASQSPGYYRWTQPGSSRGRPASNEPPRSLFGADLVTERSLDEVVLSFLAEELDDQEK
jgi:hypothetical protein